MNDKYTGRQNGPEVTEEKLWMAYLDGELSPAEALQYDAELSPAQRDRLAAEMRLESTLGDALRIDAACPDAAWAATLDKLAAAGAPTAHAGQRLGGRWRRRVWPFLTAAAAVLLVTVAYLGVLFMQPEPAFAISTPDLEAFAQSASVPPDHPAIAELFASHGFGLQLSEIASAQPDNSNSVKLLGACHVLCRGKELVQILLNCCEYPVKLVVAPRDSKAGAMMLEGARGAQIRATRDIGEYRIALIGEHGRAELLELLELCTADGDHAAR